MSIADSSWPIMAPGPNETGKPRPVVGMLAFPGLTLLDLVGAHTALTGPCETLLISKTTEPFRTDTGMEIRADVSIADAPLDLDVLFVPGGPGQVEVMDDPVYMDFLADRGSRATYVTSVCTGSIVLGAAGLLRGYKATSHWAALPLLPALGAEPVEARVVHDRNRITGGGVTAGIDFGLTLVAELFSDDIAKMVQLGMEYDPAPPFDAGSPTGAGEDIVERTMPFMMGVAEKTIAVLEKRLASDPRLAGLAEVD